MYKVHHCTTNAYNYTFIGKSSPTVPAVPQASNSPALPGNNFGYYHSPVAQSFNASGQQLDPRDEVSIRSGSAGLTPSQVREIHVAESSRIRLNRRCNSSDVYNNLLS